MGTVSLGARAKSLAGLYKSALTGRVARILPAFGFGGIGNKAVRETCRGTEGCRVRY